VRKLVEELWTFDHVQLGCVWASNRIHEPLLSMCA
jgi:hypothetical protein